MVHRLRDHLRQQGGRYVTVAEAAKTVGLSTSRASARFREEAGGSLKRFLDRERGRVAGQLVVFSDLTFKQIAYRMGFGDLFSFSRFFKRLHGASPRKLRAKGLPNVRRDR